jgi:type II secretory pathway component PulM
MPIADGLVGPIRTRFNELVGNMSPRDRRLFAGLVVTVLLGAVLTAGWLARGYLADLRSRVEDREQTLALINGLAGDYSNASDDIARIEEELRKNAGQDLSAFMEKSAQKVGISDNLKGVRERSVRTEGNLEEKSFNVDLDKVALAQVTSFLYEVETAGYPLRVRSIRVKASGAAGARLLTVAMEVSAFRLVEEAAAGEAP